MIFGSMTIRECLVTNLQGTAPTQSCIIYPFILSSPLPMQFHFDAHQSYQTEAVDSIVDIFAGQPIKDGRFSIV